MGPRFSRRAWFPRPGIWAAVSLAAGLLWGQAPPASPQAQELQVAPPPLAEGIFPCASCHDGKNLKVNPVHRELKDMHTDIRLRHGPESRWCLDCHDLLDRDSLRLANGAKLDFTVSYQLCGQCHGDKFRDWRVGIHGRRTGRWNGPKQYFLCVHCHDPHTPRFAPLAPMPAPARPESIRLKPGGDR